MKRFKLASLLFISSTLFLPKSTLASSLQTFSDSSYSSQTQNFDPGQTVWVRVSSSSNGSKSHALNLRDNNYGLVTSYNLSNSGDHFITNFSAPQNSGIYSLEARIEDDGDNQTFVQTIKVGSTGNGNSSVSVHIENSVNGQTTYSKTETHSSSKSVNSNTPNPTPQESPTPEISPSPVEEINQEVLGVQTESHENRPNIIVTAINVLKSIFLFIFLPL